MHTHVGSRRPHKQVTEASALRHLATALLPVLRNDKGPRSTGVRVSYVGQYLLDPKLKQNMKYICIYLKVVTQIFHVRIFLNTIYFWKTVPFSKTK